MANGNENEKSYVETLKIPLIVGVSGHLDIKTPEDEIKKQLDRFWEKIREAAGPNTEIILLSSIAMGADHLAVKYRPAGMKYYAVLPSDEREYRKNFSAEDDGTALADFEADLKAAYRIVTCKGAPDDYTLASDYVRKHSDVLLTLWDGNETLDDKGKAKRGGTYYQIRKAFGLDDLLPPREKVHLIVNLPVTRKYSNSKYKPFPGFPREKELMVIEKDKDDKDAEGKLVFIPFSKCDFGNHPVKTELDFFAESLKIFCKLFTIRLDREANPMGPFCDVLKFIRNHNESKLNSAVPPGQDSLQKKLKDYHNVLEIVKEDTIRYEYFDNRAQSNQTSYRKQFFWLIVITLIMGILRLTLKRHDNWIMNGAILLYLAGVVGVFRLWIKIDRQDHYTKYLEPRIIAELLRLKIFWTLAGIRDSFLDYIFDNSASNKFMVPFCNWEIADKMSDQKPPDEKICFAAVQKFWLTDQADYYHRYLLRDPKHFFVPQSDEPCTNKLSHWAVRLKKYFQIYERLDGYAKLLKAICTLGGFISAFFLLVFFVMAKICQHYPEFIPPEFISPFQGCLALAIPICFLGAAVLGWLMGKQKWDALGRQYRKTWKLFKKASDFFDDSSKNSEDKRQMVKELVKFAHEENAEWQDIRKHAKPEPMF